MTQDPPFASPQVRAAFDAFPAASRDGLLALRRLIFRTAAETPAVGPLTETLKWGQPAYLTAETKSGSTLRLGVPKSGGIAIFAHCQTTIIPDFRAVFEDAFRYDGNRAVLMESAAPVPEDKLRLLILRALTYHKRSGESG